MTLDQTIHRACLSIRRMRPDALFDGMGICGLVACGWDLGVEGSVQQRLRELFRAWPKFSGSPAFPVPAPWMMAQDSPRLAIMAAEAAWDKCPHWDTDLDRTGYAALRWELVDWLIEQTKS